MILASLSAVISRYCLKSFPAKRNAQLPPAIGKMSVSSLWYEVVMKRLPVPQCQVSTNKTPRSPRSLSDFRSICTVRASHIWQTTPFAPSLLISSPQRATSTGLGQRPRARIAGRPLMRGFVSLELFKSLAVAHGVDMVTCKVCATGLFVDHRYSGTHATPSRQSRPIRDGRL
jgi:hypothetical protein